MSSTTRAIELALIKSVSRFSIIYYYRRILIRNNLDCWLVTKQPRGLYKAVWLVSEKHN